MIYYSFVHPHILYGIEIYANSSKSSLQKLCKLNNKLLRILLNEKYDTHLHDLYNSLHVLPIPLLHEMQLLMFVHKCLFNQGLL